MEEFEKFLPADQYVVRGVSVRNRTSGVGLPLIAVRKDVRQAVSGGQAAPVTAILRVQGGVGSPERRYGPRCLGALLDAGYQYHKHE